MVPTVSLVNMASTPLGCTLPALAAALQAYVDNFVGPEWGVACKVEVIDPPPPSAQLESTLAGKWGLLLMDTSDQAGAEGYHLEGANGEPRGFAFLKSTADAGDSITVTISHELAEMLCDPLTNLCVEGPQAGRFWILEVCDAVECSDFLVNGLAMSNFLARQWYNATPPPGVKFDILGHLSAPFTLEHGGYVSFWTSRRGWGQMFGSKTAEDYFMGVKAHHRYSRHSRRLAKSPRGAHA